jgi:hypothetical protein
LLNLGFKLDELNDEKISILFTGCDKDKNNTLELAECLAWFTQELDEEQKMVESLETKEDDVPEKVRMISISR